MSKRTAVILLSLAALSAVPAAIAPVAQADVCGDVGGRHVSVGGCTNVAGDAVDAAVAGAAVVGVDDWARYGFPQSYAYSVVPAFPGEAPCISPTGLEYYTPGAEPCYVP
ncbi:MAG TPA: hypothetical protein PKI02_02510 [Mycobacterium sp.]|nr:hypothetical protein [Mycobacterium sp.]MCB9417858.1 hypothetical protein [Mycolicibacterium sp.]MCB0943717.1 hypothetical protein [Mycobacterium sp.]TXI46951.1 MAG: hypothetical protein E6Q57_09740 [Mycobacterium sp.]HNM10296.1 hypothetical protein [Mycobacterium sp.]